MEVISTAIMAALSNLANPVVKDSYNALKGLIARKFGSAHSVTNAIAELETKPTSEGRRATLREELVEWKIDKDAEIMDAAKALMSIGTISNVSNVNQTVTGNENIISNTGSITVNKK